MSSKPEKSLVLRDYQSKFTKYVLFQCYWFTIEFGICRQHGDLKAYGAGLLSSFGELEYCLTDKPEHKEFDPSVTGTTKYPITEYQPLYYVTESFEEAQRKMSYVLFFIIIYSATESKIFDYFS